MYIVLSVLLGVLIGALLPWSIPAQYSIYAAVMLLGSPGMPRQAASMRGCIINSAAPSLSLELWATG